VAMDGESCILELLYGNITFRLTFVKLYFILITQIKGIKIKPIRKELASKELLIKPAPLLVKRNKE
jgi:hypothetical protein